MISLVFILLLLAFGKDVALKIFSQKAALNIASAGVLLLVAIAFEGYQKGYFFANFMGQGWPYEIWSAGVIPFLNVAIGLVVVGCLYGIFVALSTYRADEEDQP